MTFNEWFKTRPERDFHSGSLNAMQPKEHASDWRASRLAWAVCSWRHPDSPVASNGGVATSGEVELQGSLKFLSTLRALLQAKGPSDSLGMIPCIYFVVKIQAPEKCTRYALKTFYLWLRNRTVAWKQVNKFILRRFVLHRSHSSNVSTIFAGLRCVNAILSLNTVVIWNVHPANVDVASRLETEKGYL